MYNNNNMQGGQVYNEDFKIPDRLVGLVIGRGGEQIKRMQMESQCKIRIASDSDGTSERSCTLTGSQEAIDHAKHMLDEVIRRGQNREGGQQQGGGGGNGGGYQNNGGGYGGNRR
jgi:far upstream element-binding protein